MQDLRVYRGRPVFQSGLSTDSSVIVLLVLRCEVEPTVSHDLSINLTAQC